MKQSKLLLSLFAFFVVWTVGFTIFSIYCLAQAKAQDPQILTKLASKASQNHMNFNSFNLSLGKGLQNPHTYTPAIDSWKMPLQSMPVQVDVQTVDADLDVTVDPTVHEILVSAQGDFDASVSQRMLIETIEKNRILISQAPDEATQNLHIQIRLPPESSAKLTVQTVSGQVRLKKMKLSSAKIETISGSAQVEYSVIDDLEVRSVSGLVSIDNEFTKSESAQTVSGDLMMKLSDPNSVSIEAATLSGQLVNPFGSGTAGKPKMQVNSTSGNIQIE